MFLHIGENESVFLDSVIGIFDLESATTMETTKNFITTAEKNGEILINSELMPKTFVLTEESGISSVYISSVNVSTLRKRIDKILEGKKDFSSLAAREVFFNTEG